jgi:YgiT-type zinc finger domain-containing protein
MKIQDGPAANAEARFAFIKVVATFAEKRNSNVLCTAIGLVGVKTMTDNPVCPNTGAPMRRDVRPMTLTFKGESITFDQPGWYCDQSDEGILVGKDLRVSDRMLNRLKAHCEGLLEPEEIRRIRSPCALRFDGKPGVGEISITAVGDFSVVILSHHKGSN